MMKLAFAFLLFTAPAYASNNCSRMKATDTLVLGGHRQRHPERFVECIVGHWPNVDSVFRYERHRK